MFGYHKILGRATLVRSPKFLTKFNDICHFQLVFIVLDYFLISSSNLTDFFSKTGIQLQPGAVFIFRFSPSGFCFEMAEDFNTPTISRREISPSTLGDLNFDIEEVIAICFVSIDKDYKGQNFKLWPVIDTPPT
ncbi:hypothetical protein HNY73_011740 [Argiope bruennichi]|uniref:Uncharacterized protein n=1 Tax=Argiope bruennichi TaxID=94029 RepID=A0A8T0F3M7_ARGBR|nr:hypothetical protein HNY73_011740 [Argiope bruennichi]